LVASLLRDITRSVNTEPGSGPRFSLRFSKTTLLISEVFSKPKARHAHEIGPRVRNIYCLAYLRDMPAYPANIYRHHVLHGKCRTMLGKEVAPTSRNKILTSSAV
ncbi:hypothetical protein M441DRAFT_454382, partial [Trichoderma asperellum CBS 433.97]